MTDRLSFTGSSGVGHTVLHAAANRLVPSCVELGGKGAIVVFDDADVNSTVDWIMVGIFLNAGQCCSATSRLLVQSGIAPKILERLTSKARSLRIGDTLAEDTQLGPLTSKEQLDTVIGFIQRAVEE